MSSTTVLAPIIKALMVAAQFLNTDPAGYQSISEKQEQFLQKHYTQQTRDELAHFTAQELKAKASTSVAEINQFLKENGFTIELSPLSEQGFAVASILDVALEWKAKGDQTTIATAHKVYDAVEISRHFHAFTTDNHPEPIVCLRTKSRDTVYITKAHQEPLVGDALLEHIKAIQNSTHAIDSGYTSIVFPMVDLDKQENISWLKGMMLKDYCIAQALQQTKFKMNEVGARVKSAVALAFDSCCFNPEEKKLVIDEPFYIWIERDGVTTPVFAAYITQKNWKNPENLEM